MCWGRTTSPYSQRTAVNQRTGENWKMNIPIPFLLGEKLRFCPIIKSFPAGGITDISSASFPSLFYLYTLFHVVFQDPSQKTLLTFVFLSQVLLLEESNKGNEE
jgi:hypothetical protein